MMLQDEAINARSGWRVLATAVTFWALMGMGSLLFVFTAQAALKLAEATLG